MASAEFDYVVIGAGSAGCVVAGRLADAGHRVCLLEAGGKDRNPWIHVPLGYSLLYANPNVNWCYTSEPEPHLNDRRLFQPRGKVLGGTSAINGMIYMRGQPQDFDGWAENGCTGWGWQDVLPYFKKSEDQQRGPSEYHGTGGPLAVSDLPSKHALGEAYHAASAKLGSPLNDDFNGAEQLGTGYVQVNTRNGRRCSSASGFLNGPGKHNIRQVLHAMVEKIDIQGKRAVSVTYSDKSGRKQVTPRREIILCGGAFNSPQLLQLSGIGPAGLLRQHGIKVQNENSAVGENLQDHFGIGAEYRSTLKSTVNDIYNNKIKGGAQLLRYLLFRSGPFADNGNYSNTFICTSPEIKTPDMMITFMAWCTAENLKPHPFSGFTILSEHIRPQSRGTVRITGAKSIDAPAIQFNFLSSEADQKAAIAGLRYARKIAQTAPMSETVDSELAPGADKTSDEDLLTYCRESGLSLLHPVGTCRMGIGDDGVVDPKLRVIGIDGMRVVDASIMPRIVSANTHAAAVMIGEKGADMILADAKL